MKREMPLQPLWLRGTLLVLLALAITMLVWWPMIDDWPGTPEGDGRYVQYQFDIAKMAILRYGELPLWNPFDCRGIPLWDHPETMTASPLLLLMTGVEAGKCLWAWNIFHGAAGFIGMWLFVRHDINLSRVATFAAATMWTVGVGHVGQYAGGHETLISFYNAPLMLFLWRRAAGSANAAVGLGIVIAWMVYDGATYPLPYSILMLVVEAIPRFFKRPLDVLKAGVITGITGIALSAARLLPIIQQAGAHHRELAVETDELLRWSTLWPMFAWREWHWYVHLAGQEYVYGEYINYIGIPLIALSFFGALVALGNKRYRWTLWAGGFVFILMLGHFAPWAPWSFLKAHVYPFSSMRVPSRFRLLLDAFLCVWVGISIDYTATFLSPVGRAIRVFVLGLAFLGVGDTASITTEIITSRFKGPPITHPQPSTRFHYGGSNLTPDWMDQPRQNEAWLGCRAEFAFHTNAPLWTGDVPQARTTSSDAVVEVANRTHNTFTIDVDAKRPTRILLNSAYDVGWTSDIGKVVEEKDLLAIDIPEGRHRLHVKYWPPRLTLGFTITGIGILAVAAFFNRRRLMSLASKLKKAQGSQPPERPAASL